MLRKYFIAGVAAISFVLAAIFASLGSSQIHADTSLDNEEVIFMGLVNAYRADHQLEPLLIDSSLQNAAEWMSTDMGEKNYFSHTDSLGRSPWDRMCHFNYCHNTWKGENIAAGYVTGEDVFAGWQGSPGHNANMLGEHYRVMGLARVHTQGSDFGWYWTNDFGGEIIDLPPPPGPTNTPTPTSTVGQTASPVPTVTPTPTPTATHTPKPTAAPTKAPTPSPTMTPTLSPISSHSPEQAADVNCDSRVTGTDALRVLRFTAGVDSSSYQCPEMGTQSTAGGGRPRGDVNCDGWVDANDALLILRYSTGDTSAISECA